MTEGHRRRDKAARTVAAGVGMAMLAPVAVATLANMARPLARAAAKTGSVFYEKGREALDECSEILEDLAAEARAEANKTHRSVSTDTQAPREADAGRDPHPGGRNARLERADNAEQDTGG